MATKKFIDLTVQSEKKELDLISSLGRDKGKRPIEESSEKENKRKKQSVLEDTISDHSSEEKIAFLKKEIEGLEKLVRRQNDEIAERIDRYFFWSTRCFYSQNQKNLECMTKIYTKIYDALNGIAQALSQRNVSEVMVQNTPSSSNPEAGAPSSSKDPSGTKKSHRP